MYFLCISNNKLIGIDCLGYQEEGISYPIEQVEVPEEIYKDYLENPDKYIWDGENVVENPDYEFELARKRERAFIEQFFKTSLGWVKRSVTMKDGSERNFLTDILPLLQVGIPVITYNEPDFTTDEPPTQNRGQIVTETFLQECKMQLLNDFYGDAPEEPYTEANIDNDINDTEESEDVDD